METADIDRWTVISQDEQQIEYTTGSLQEAKDYIRNHCGGIHADLIDESKTTLVWCSQKDSLDNLDAICE
jgi:hypothetical protein